MENDTSFLGEIRNEQKRFFNFVAFLTFILIVATGLLFLLAINFDSSWNRFTDKKEIDTASIERIIEETYRLKYAKDFTKEMTLRAEFLQNITQKLDNPYSILTFASDYANQRFNFRDLTGKSVYWNIFRLSVQNQNTIVLHINDIHFLPQYKGVSTSGSSLNFKFENSKFSQNILPKEIDPRDEERAKELLGVLEAHFTNSLHKYISLASTIDRESKRHKITLEELLKPEAVVMSDFISLVVNRVFVMMLLVAVGGVCLRLISRQYHQNLKARNLCLSYKLACEEVNLQGVKDVLDVFQEESSNKSDDSAVGVITKLLEFLNKK